MIALVWIYAVIGTFYSFMYMMDFELVVKHAVGPLWLMMVAAPVVLVLLVCISIGKR